MGILRSTLRFFNLAPNEPTGLLDDTRPQTEKDKSYLHEERLFPQATNPFGNPQITESPYPYENQNNTFSCVPHAVGLALGIERMADLGSYERISPIFAYRLRSNFPDAGSAPADIYDIYKNKGAPLYTTLPTPREEIQANVLNLSGQEYNEASIYKGKTFWTIKNPNDIHTLANIAQQGHAVSICIFATYDEYAVQFPKISSTTLDSHYAEIRHCVTILPHSGFTKDGIKYVVVQDSAWFGGWKLRCFSEEWIKNRVYGVSGYWDTVSQLGNGPRPHYTFTKVLKVGATGAEVIALQQLLISEGLLPNDCATGFFGGRTLAGVNAFQNRYAAEILVPIHLDAPSGFWGSASIAKANSLTSA